MSTLYDDSAGLFDDNDWPMHGRGPVTAEQVIEHHCYRCRFSYFAEVLTECTDWQTAASKALGHFATPQDVKTELAFLLLTNPQV